MNPMSALAETPRCKATQEALLREDSNLRLTNDCLACTLLGVRCLIASHPSSSGMSCCTNLPLFPCNVSLPETVNVSKLCSKLCTSILSPIRMPFGTLLSVPAGAAGRIWVGFLSVIPACCSFRKFGPCGGRYYHVLSVSRFFPLLFPSPFFMALFHFSNSSL
jgi:hypothetical protein